MCIRFSGLQKSIVWGPQRILAILILLIHMPGHVGAACLAIVVAAECGEFTAIALGKEQCSLALRSFNHFNDLCRYKFFPIGIFCFLHFNDIFGMNIFRDVVTSRDILNHFMLHEMTVDV